MEAVKAQGESLEALECGPAFSLLLFDDWAYCDQPAHVTLLPSLPRQACGSKSILPYSRHFLSCIWSHQQEKQLAQRLQRPSFRCLAQAAAWDGWIRTREQNICIHPLLKVVQGSHSTEASNVLWAGQPRVLMVLGHIWNLSTHCPWFPAPPFSNPAPSLVLILHFGASCSFASFWWPQSARGTEGKEWVSCKAREPEEQRPSEAPQDPGPDPTGLFIVQEEKHTRRSRVICSSCTAGKWLS